MAAAPDNVQEALLVEGINVYAPLTLTRLVIYLQIVAILPAEAK